MNGKVCGVYFALVYDYVPDYFDRRKPHREAHLAGARRAAEEGWLVLGGAFNDSPPGALLVFEAEDAARVEAFAKSDPYIINGVVTAWRVREWNVVAGRN